MYFVAQNHALYQSSQVHTTYVPRFLLEAEEAI